MNDEAISWTSKTGTLTKTLTEVSNGSSNLAEFNGRMYKLVSVSTTITSEYTNSGGTLQMSYPGSDTGEGLAFGPQKTIRPMGSVTVSCRPRRVTDWSPFYSGNTVISIAYDLGRATADAPWIGWAKHKATFLLGPPINVNLNLFNRHHLFTKSVLKSLSALVSDPSYLREFTSPKLANITEVDDGPPNVTATPVTISAMLNSIENGL